MATTDIRPAPLPSSPSSNKRKRNISDHGTDRDAKVQHINQDNDGYSDFNVMTTLQGALADGSAQTAQAALATQMPSSHYPDAFEAAHHLPSFGDDGSTSNDGTQIGATARAVYDARAQQAISKAPVGSEQWHTQRKINHKEVERRRREVINEGIDSIAKIVPGTEKNKGAILARTCTYIAELKSKVDNQEANFQNERNVFQSTLNEITNRFNTVKRESERAWAEAQKWQQRCRDAGLAFDDYDLGGVDDLPSASLGGDGATDGFDDPTDANATATAS